MIKALRPPRGVCASCLRRVSQPQQHQRRWLSAPGPLRYSHDRVVPVDHGAPGKQHDDAILRKIFDSPSTWLSFSKTTASKNVGLFRNAYLTRPEGFISFANISLKRARRIVDKVLAASTVEEYRKIVRQL